MISTFVSIVAVGLVLYVIYKIAQMFIKDQPLSVVEIILGLIFVLYALRTARFISL